MKIIKHKSLTAVFRSWSRWSIGLIEIISLSKRNGNSQIYNKAIIR